MVSWIEGTHASTHISYSLLDMIALYSVYSAALINRAEDTGKTRVSGSEMEGDVVTSLLQLPVNIRAHVSNMTFDSGTYSQVFEAADKVFLSSKQKNLSPFL